MECLSFVTFLRWEHNALTEVTLHLCDLEEQLEDKIYSTLSIITFVFCVFVFYVHQLSWIFTSLEPFQVHHCNRSSPYITVSIIYRASSSNFPSSLWEKTNKKGLLSHISVWFMPVLKPKYLYFLWLFYLPNIWSSRVNIPRKNSALVSTDLNIKFKRRLYLIKTLSLLH